MKVLTEVLKFKNLKIYQNSQMFSFSLDSVLLARFVKLSNRVKQVLDIGTNNAIIPLLLARRFEVNITGVEVQSAASELAQENIELNNCATKIKIVTADIRKFALDFKNNKFDCIVSNPPFFPVTSDSHQTLKSPELNIARHELMLTLEELINSAKLMIANRGSFYLVHRSERIAEIIRLLEKNHFNVKRMQFIYPFYNKISQSVLIESRFYGNPGVTIEPPIITHNPDGSYSSQVQTYFTD